MHIVALVAVILLSLLSYAIKKDYRDRTGVDLPSARAWRGIKARGRKRGLSEEQTYYRWLAQAQKRERYISTAVVSPLQEQRPPPPVNASEIGRSGLAPAVYISCAFLALGMLIVAFGYFAHRTQPAVEIMPQPEVADTELPLPAP